MVAAQRDLWGQDAPIRANNELLWPIAPAPGAWAAAWDEFLKLDAAHSLMQRLQQRRRDAAVIYPQDPLRMLRLTPLDRVKVVILGQDPYHGANQAQGLAFSVPEGSKLPPSLRNIFKELRRDFGSQTPPPEQSSGDLGRWASQGVLLLNASLTVEEAQAGAHANWGWEVFTDALIQLCSEHGQAKAFLLWGNHAQKKRGLIDARHLSLMANHPSPLSANRGPVPFMGCGHFSQVNEWLKAQGLTPVDW